MLCWKPRENFFRVRESSIFIRENFITIGYYELYCIHIQLVKGYLQSPAPGTPAGEGYRIILVWFWFNLLYGFVFRTFIFPFIGSGRASKSEALPQLEVRTAGRQPASCPAQCLPLDLNLRAAQLSVHRWADQLTVHRWTSTRDLPSSVCTAGPQPETCPAQRAPLDLNNQIECQKICQIKCEIECQKICQIKYHEIS